MYEDKIAYFDGQAAAPWAAREYTADERARLERVFQLAGPLNDAVVLEPGCGTGRLTEILSEAIGPQGMLVAVDISPAMVEAARLRMAGRSNAIVGLGSVENLPLARNFYDLIFCHQVFPHFENPGLALKILARTLKPGGRFLVFHFINSTVINDRHRKAGTAVEMDMMPDAEAMRGIFQAAGLTITALADDENGYCLCAVKKGKEQTDEQPD